MRVNENYQLFFLCLNVLHPSRAKNHKNTCILENNQLGLVQYLLPLVKIRILVTQHITPLQQKSLGMWVQWVLQYEKVPQPATQHTMLGWWNQILKTRIFEEYHWLQGSYVSQRGPISNGSTPISWSNCPIHPLSVIPLIYSTASIQFIVLLQHTDRGNQTFLLWVLEEKGSEVLGGERCSCCYQGHGREHIENQSFCT